MMTKLKKGDLVYLRGKTYKMHMPDGTMLGWRAVESYAIYLGLTVAEEAGLSDTNWQYYNFYLQNTGKIIQIDHHDREGANSTGSWKDLIYGKGHGHHRVEITLLNKE